MKKLWFVLTLMAVFALFMVGCNKQETPKTDVPAENGGSQTENNGSQAGNGGETNKDTEKTPEELPTLAEILELNQLENVFKTHSNVYTYAVYTQDDYEFKEDLICVKGNGKADYHQRTKYSYSDDYEYTSGVGNVRYRVNESKSIIYEVGDPFFSNVKYLEMESAVQVGKGYIENDMIVYHAYQIIEGFEDISTMRYDHTFYFNKDTKLIEKLGYVGYDSNHKVFSTYTSTVSYDVDIESRIGVTAYDIMNNGDRLIELEMIKGYNTPEQKAYTLTVPFDAEITLTIENEFYALFSDAELTNYVSSLESFIGEEKVTLYAVPFSDFEEIRYTVTEEEWAALTTENNYTVEKIMDGERVFLHKYTEDTLAFDEEIIILVDNKQYYLEETENGWVAYDCTFVDYWHGGLLEQTDFDDYFFDENLSAYVNKDFEEAGMRVEIRFENGVIVSSTSIIIDDETGEESQLSFTLYTDIGETAIAVPDFTFYYDLEADPAKLATEEIWNSYIGVKNFTAIFATYENGEYVEHIFKSTDDAFEIDGKIIVSDSGKTYELEEADGVWYAVEYNGIILPESLLPEGLSFNDFEYNQQYELYLQKDKDEEYIYSVGFENGALVYVELVKTNPTNPMGMEVIAFMISEIGTAEITVPEYIIVEAE